MTRAEKVKEAQRLRDEGMSYADISEALGYKRSSAQGLKLVDPEWAKAQAKKTNARRGPAKRAWDKSDRGRGRCAACGGLKGVGTGSLSRLCQDCNQAARRKARSERGHLIEGLWAEGLTLRQIGERLGWTPVQVGVEIAHLRARAFDLPHRRTPEQLANIRAGQAKAAA